MYIVYVNIVLIVINAIIGFNAYLKDRPLLTMFAFAVCGLCAVGAYSRYLLIKTVARNKELLKKFYPKD